MAAEDQPAEERLESGVWGVAGNDVGEGCGEADAGVEAAKTATATARAKTVLIFCSSCLYSLGVGFLLSIFGETVTHR